MTKLTEWLSGLVLLFGVWYSLLTEKIGSQFAQEHPLFVLLWPVGLVALFGIYSILVIAVRVYNFDDCLEAAEELKKQTIEAKADLKKKGLKF